MSKKNESHSCSMGRLAETNLCERSHLNSFDRVSIRCTNLDSSEYHVASIFLCYWNSIDYCGH